VDAFRREVREHMDREAAAVIRNRLRDSVVDAVHKANAIQLPTVLVQQEQQRLGEQVKENLKRYGIAPEAAGEKLTDPALFQEQARKRVAVQLVVAEIIRRQDIKPDAARVRTTVENMARSYEDPAAIVSWYYADRSRLAEVEAMVLEDAVIDWIASRAKIREVKVAFDELVNKRQTESGQGV
jgi:trigger factor